MILETQASPEIVNILHPQKFSLHIVCTHMALNMYIKICILARMCYFRDIDEKVDFMLL